MLLNLCYTKEKVYYWVFCERKIRRFSEIHFRNLTLRSGLCVWRCVCVCVCVEVCVCVWVGGGGSLQ